jgi:hypothetical protein
MLREGFTSKSDYICACIAESKISHHLSTMGLAVVFRRLRQRLASFLHSFRSCCKVRASLRKTTPFLRFQSCQQQSAKNILKCSLGMWGGHGIWRSSEVGRVGGTSTPIVAQNETEKGQALMICSVVSSPWLHTLQVVESTTPFLCRFARHWVLPCTSSQMNNLTLSGAAELQMNSEFASCSAPLDLSIL